MPWRLQVSALVELIHQHNHFSASSEFSYEDERFDLLELVSWANSRVFVAASQGPTLIPSMRFR